MADCDCKILFCDYCDMEIFQGNGISSGFDGYNSSNNPENMKASGRMHANVEYCADNIRKYRHEVADVQSGWDDEALNNLDFPLNRPIPPNLPKNWKYSDVCGNPNCLCGHKFE